MKKLYSHFNKDIYSGIFIFLLIGPLVAHQGPANNSDIEEDIGSALTQLAGIIIEPKDNRIPIGNKNNNALKKSPCAKKLTQILSQNLGLLEINAADGIRQKAFSGSCTGTLIASKWVVTAAHCVIHEEIGASNKRSNRNLKITFFKGALNQSDLNHPIAVKRFFVPHQTPQLPPRSKKKESEKSPAELAEDKQNWTTFREENAQFLTQHYFQHESDFAFLELEKEVTSSTPIELAADF